ncbi:hypothetical protein [Streptomyces sp. RKAG290]|uniref:hypothetical protein n=1 Tax=Streptomyces sp. RKAG290 TaxID=2888348 RepID=UPI0035A87647
MELDLFEADTHHPECAELIGGGMFFALGDHRGFLAHRESDGSLHIYTPCVPPRTGCPRSTSPPPTPPRPHWPGTSPTGHPPCGG